MPRFRLQALADRNRAWELPRLLTLAHVGSRLQLVRRFSNSNAGQPQANVSAKGPRAEDALKRPSAG
jgi:hypothetical protein